MNKLSFLLFLGAIFLTSCATSTQVLESDVRQVNLAKMGAVLSVNLQTNGRVRDDKDCFLNIDDGKNNFKLLINKGVGDYALPLGFSESVIEITKISCGPFYYYDLKGQGAVFHLKSQKIKYLGFLNFKLQDKGELEWGHATKNEIEIRNRTRSMGLDNDSLEIDLLKL